MEPNEKEEIRARTNIVELVSGYTELRKTGRTFKGRCPFHTEKTPSFQVDPERGRWHCFGACSTGGDIFTFLEKAEGLTFIEAAERLAERAGIQLTRTGMDRDEADRQRQERDRIFAANTLAVRFFRHVFSRVGLARDYANRRGLSQETLESFGVGFAPDDWSQLANFLLKNGVNPVDAEKAGLIFPSRMGDGFTDKFRGRIMFPIWDIQERVVAFGGRIIVANDNAPKYMNSPETPVFSKSRILYALNKAKKAIAEHDRIVVVEGYMDVVACHQAGIEYVVAPLGTSVTEEHVRLMRRYTKNIVLSFDSDDAGVRAALRAAELIQSVAGQDGDMSLRILSLPPGDDPDSMIGRGDASGFRKAIDAALTVPAFRLKTLEARYDTGNDAGKLAFLREALPIVADINSALERDMLIRTLAVYHPTFATGGARVEESLRADIDNFRRGNHSPNSFGPPIPVVEGGAPISLRGDVVAPGKAKRFGAPTNYARNNQTNQRRTPPPVYYDNIAPGALPKRTAGEEAERTILRALLDEQWQDTLQGKVPVAFFSDPRDVQLITVLQPLLEGNIAPEDAIASLTDDTLADRAMEIRFDPNALPLNEQMIVDCLTTLERQHQRREMEQIRINLATGQGGNKQDDDEMLRRWQEKARAMKRREADDNESNGF